MKITLFAFLLSAIPAYSHDAHGLVHDHVSGFLYLLAWAGVAAVLYIVQALRDDK